LNDGFDVDHSDGRLILALKGHWTIATASGLEPTISTFTPDFGGEVVVDVTAVVALDSVGALLVAKLCRRLSGPDRDVKLIGAEAGRAELIDRARRLRPLRAAAKTKPRGPVAWVADIGSASMNAMAAALHFASFFGLICTRTGELLFKPWRLRLAAVISHLEAAGLNGIPIVAMLSFLIGVVLAYQGADQLRQFGAEIFTVDLLGVSILRETGVLMTAIVVAGRSGSAFAAQIGTMQANQEIDAIRVIGLDPVEVLVLPRLIALVIAMPLLTVLADLSALLGGALMLGSTLDIPIGRFALRLHEAVPLSYFWVGIVKAPVFGLLIAFVGCREGMRVTGSAESVGRHTTKAVVISIFLVIAADAGFSVFFSLIGV
jgi:phospholipid/cholesterol/gamma-HCH transport system permease protein